MMWLENRLQEKVKFWLFVLKTLRKVVFPIAAVRTHLCVWGISVRSQLPQQCTELNLFVYKILV
jgi:hypothetical protein